MLASLYDQNDFTRRYEPRFAMFRNAGRRASLRPASSDVFRILALNIDNLRDFGFPDGALPVPGALADGKRFVNWISLYSDEITSILSICDLHDIKSIFHAIWWRNRLTGKDPDPFTVITLADVESGLWIPRYDRKWSLEYVRLLDSGGKKQLTIWPDHCLSGTDGQKLLPAVHEAIIYHAAARNYLTRFLTKGTVPQVEHYGFAKAEVLFPGNIRASGIDESLMREIAGYNRIYVAGQAKSHCVYESLKQLTEYFADEPEVISKIYLLTDCTSSIAGFEEGTEADLAKLVELGINVVKSTDPLN